MKLIDRIRRLLFDAPPPEPDDLVKIRTFDTATQAHIARTILASNDIPAFVKNEGEVYVPQIRQGVWLMIFYRDWERASELLKDM